MGTDVLEREVRSLHRLVVVLFTLIVIHMSVVWTLNILQSSSIEKNQAKIQTVEKMMRALDAREHAPVPAGK